MSRFVEIWNGIPGHTPVKKFQNRNKAVARVWTAIQPLAGNGHPSESAAEKPAVPGKAGKPAEKVKAADQPTGDKASVHSNKKAEVIAMITRDQGATLADIMEATGWQKHTVRGFISILGSKVGHTIDSSRNAAGERTYNVTK